MMLACLVLASLVFLAVLIFTQPPTPQYGFLQDAKRVKLEMRIVPGIRGGDVLTQETIYTTPLPMRRLEMMVESETADSAPLSLYYGQATVFTDAKNRREIFVHDVRDEVEIIVSEIRTPTMLDRVRIWVMERMPSRSDASEDSP